MNIKEILQCRDYLKSLGLTRWYGQDWKFNDKLLHPYYKIVYEYAGEWTIYTRTEVRKWDDKYELVTNSLIVFSGDVEEFKEKVKSAVENYKKAVQKIKELKAKEDF